MLGRFTPTRHDRVRLSAAQRDALAAIARADVTYFALGGHYRRRDLAIAVRTDTMNVLIAAGLACLPPRAAADRMLTVSITEAGRAVLCGENH